MKFPEEEGQLPRVLLEISTQMASTSDQKEAWFSPRDKQVAFGKATYSGGLGNLPTITPSAQLVLIEMKYYMLAGISNKRWGGSVIENVSAFSPKCTK